MRAKTAMYALAACLVVASAAAMTTTRSWFEAYTSGARTVALRGTASYGKVAGGASGPFVVTLGADAPDGAVLFTRTDGRPLTPGPIGWGRIRRESSRAWWSRTGDPSDRRVPGTERHTDDRGRP